MSRIFNYLRSVRHNQRLSNAVNRMKYLPPGSLVSDPILINHLDQLVFQARPDLSKKLKKGFWFTIWGCYGCVTFEHTEIENYQVAIAV